MPKPYLPRRAAQSVFVPVRGLRYHAHVWGDASLVTPGRPPLVLMQTGAGARGVVVTASGALRP